MENVSLIVDLVLALGVAFLGGFVAQRLGLPVLIGYILAGSLIGPNTPGLVANHGNVETLANIGVAFLMFAIGVELSLEELNRVRRVALLTGAIQIPLSIGLGLGAGLMLGWSWQASTLLGCCFALSSTIVAIKISTGKGEMTSPYARTALGIGIVQDLMLVPIMALVPVLKGDAHNLPLTLAKSLGIATVMLLAVIVIGTVVAPRVLFAVARIESRELFLLTIVVIALGTAIVAEQAGLSLALGAFLAGLIVSESEFNNQVLSEIIPLRDLFATLFFVSVGMLLEPGFILDNWVIVVGLLLAVMVGKSVILGGALLATGANYRVSVRAATLLAQMGEFSFVLAGVGLAEGILNPDHYGMILAVALGSIVLTPFLTATDPLLLRFARSLPGIKRREISMVGQDDDDHLPLRQGVVICGYGRVGMVLGEVLASHNVDYAVIELNPITVRALRDSGVSAIYGDSGSPEILHRAGIHHASVIVVTVPDDVSAYATVRQARASNPEIHIIARSSSRQQVPLLYRAGADTVIQPELEAGLTCVADMLRALGVPTDEAEEMLILRRSLLYGEMR